MTSETLGTKKIIDRGKLHYRRGTDDINFVIPELLDFDMYKMQHLANLEPEFRSLVLDCGAHIGIFSLLAAVNFRRVNIHAFEPQADNFDLLTKNTVEYKNIICHNEAVGMLNEKMKLYQSGSCEEGLTGRWSFLPKDIDQQTQTYEEVKCIDLNEFILNQDQAIFILKLDLEGYEAKLITGLSAKALHRVKILIIEEHTEPVNLSKIEDNGFKLIFHPLDLPQHSVLINQYFWEQPFKTEFSVNFIHSTAATLNKLNPLQPKIIEVLTNFVEDRQCAWNEMLILSEAMTKVEVELSLLKSTMDKREAWIKELEEYRDLLKSTLDKREVWIKELEDYRDLLKSTLDKREGWIKELEDYRDLLKSTLDKREGWIFELEKYRDDLLNIIKERDTEISNLNDGYRQLEGDLQSITNSRSYRLAKILSTSPYLQPLKKAALWIFRQRKNLVDIVNARRIQSLEDTETSPDIRQSTVSFTISAKPFTAEEISWLERFSHDPKALSVLHPDWMGMHSSATQLFDEIYTISDNLDEFTAHRYARLFIESSCPAIVIHGFPLTYSHLVAAIHELSPELPIFNIWHGGFVQANEYTDWNAFSLIYRYCQDGVIRKWGFVKKGMAEIVGKNNISTSFIMNMVRNIPEAASITQSRVPTIGIWGSWRKWPYAMMASAKLLDDSKLFIWGANERTIEFDRLFHLDARIDTESLGHAEVMKQLAKMDINLYVSLYECAPMLPLESLSVGVPCLLGPHSHYFEDDPYLYERLIVRAPDRADVIADSIKKVLPERENIIKSYRSYAINYNQQARKQLIDFLELDEKEIWA